jgi:peptidyl-prolyl cis-trans isomerase C
MLTLLALAMRVAAAAAQTGADSLPPPPKTAPEVTLPLTTAAAKVNDQVIPEAAVQRGLKSVPPARRTEARPALLDFLVEKALLDQYLAQLKVDPTRAELDKRVEEVYAEMKKQNIKVEEFLKDLMMTEAEFRAEIEADVRWEKFVNDQGTEEKLKKYFEGNRDIFDGTQVRARHIQMVPPTPDARAVEAVTTRLREVKKQVDEAGKAAVAGLPPNADDFTKKTTYNDAVDRAFAEQARQCSSCASRMVGGDLSWFERTGGPVEPFARAAFGLELFQMSDVVQTQLGTQTRYHLILLTDRRPGREVKFEDVKDRVKKVYGDRLREAVVAAMKPRARIEITPAPKASE